MGGLTRVEKQEITGLGSFALRKSSIFFADKLYERLTKKQFSPIGSIPEYNRRVWFGKQEYMVVFSVEELPVGVAPVRIDEYLTAPKALARHVSISSPKSLKVENVNSILKLLGFQTGLITLDEFTGEKIRIHHEAIVIHHEVNPHVTVGQLTKAINVIEFSSDLAEKFNGR